MRRGVSRRKCDGFHHKDFRRLVSQVAGPDLAVAGPNNALSHGNGNAQPTVTSGGASGKMRGAEPALCGETSMTAVFQILAPLVVAIHLAWILWVITGVRWTRGRPWLTAFHVASLVWGIVVETCPVNCPLTLAEQGLEAAAGMRPWAGGFLLHYLDAIVYPNLPVSLLIALGVMVCGSNLLIYAWRLFQLLGSRH